MSVQRDLFGRPLPTSSSSSRPPNLSPPSNHTTTPIVPSFTPPLPRSSMPLDPASEAKMAAFREVKPTCVQLMGIATQPPSTVSAHAPLLTSLNNIVSTLPPAAFTPSLINYLLFPLTTTLRQSPNPSALPDAFLEAAFRLLAQVVGHWRAVPGGMDVASWEQLWRFTVSAVGPRSGEGKERQIGQEVQLDALSLLAALLEPHTEDGVSHPTPAMRKATTGTKSPLMPTLFMSITLAVDCSSPSPPHPTLQRAAVRLVRTLLGYLSGQSEVLASVLPGVVSAMSKDILALGKALKGDVGAEMTGAIQDAVTETLADETLRHLGVLRPQFNDLSELAEEWERSPVDIGADVPPSPAPSATSTLTSSSKGPGNPFPPLTASYVEFTGARLQSTIPPVLAALASHASDLARAAASSLAYALISHCSESLPRLLPPALSTLLLLSRDTFDPVRDDALHKLHRLLKTEDAGIDTALIDLLSSAINSLPRLIRSEQDLKVNDVARLVTAISKITASTDHPAIAQLLGPSGHVERWAYALLECLELGRPRGWSNVNAAHRTAELGWSGAMVSGSKQLQIEPGEEGGGGRAPPHTSYPHLPLRYVESEPSARALAGMLESLGATGGESALHSIDYFIRFASAHRSRDTAKAVSTLWVVQRLLTGVASNHERAPKGVRKMARQVARAIVAMGDEDDEDAEWEGGDTGEPADAESLVPVERSKGLDSLTTLLDKTPRNSSAAEETRRLHQQAQKVLLSALSLSTLSACAGILGTGFRPLLLHALYDILAALSSPHDLVRTYAETALAHVAYETGYASPQNLVLDNVDYVVNVVSQRLTYHRLSPHAPLVLIAMIRLVGAPIVPLVHDVVDEIFDALDDFHGYSALASALLAVLTTLIDVMAEDTARSGPVEKRGAERADARRMLDPPNPRKDFGNFAKWYNARREVAKAEVADILERGPRRAWGKEGDKENEAGQGEEEKMDEDKPDKPTRSQEVASQILSKATYYLSHASPFLRARVLGLISRAIPVLAQSGREADLLPLIERAWPTILARLDDSVPYVVAEAVSVIAALAEYVGDYVSQRVSDAWSRLARILKAQRALEAKGSLKSEFTVSHRLQLAILGTAKFIAREVGVKDSVLWDMMLSFRPLLDRRGEREVQDRTVELYHALAGRDADALWVALNATMGTLEGDRGLWSYLRDKGLEIEENAVRRIFAENGAGGEGAVEEVDLDLTEAGLKNEEPLEVDVIDVEPVEEYALDDEFDLD